MAQRYVTFLVDPGAGVVPGTLSKSPDTRHPETDDVLKVICDGGKVTVVAKRDKQTRVIANARWRDGLLVRRTAAKKAPGLSEDQWTLIGACLAQHAPVEPRPPRRPTAPAAPTLVAAEPPQASDSTRFVPVEPPPGDMPLRLEQPTPRFRAIVWGTFAGIIVIAGLVAFAVSRKDEPETVVAAPSPPPRPAKPPPPPPPHEEPIEVQLARAESFTDAVRIVKPVRTMTGEASATLFATYAANKLRWEDVDVAAETSFGHVLKDAEVERGKRMCAEGELLAIQRRDLGARKIYVGSLRVSPADQISLIAVGATGELIRGSKARFCGAVTGLTETRVWMVGMFDLPENRTPIVEQ